MIAKMKKMHLVHLSSQKDKTLKKLGKLGVMHIEDKRRDTEDRQHVQEQIDNVNAALMNLGKTGKDISENVHLDDAVSIAGKILAVVNGIKEHQGKLAEIRNTIKLLSAWGDFNPEEIKKLADKGIFVSLYELGDSSLKTVDDSEVFLVFSEKGKNGVALVTKDKNKKLDFPEFQLPVKSISELSVQVDELSEHLEILNNELAGFSSSAPLLRGGLQLLDNNYQFAEAESNISEEGAVSYLTGYVPEDKLADVQDACSKNGWGLVYGDPEEGDPVPTSLRNPKAVGIIEPLFDLLGNLPGYNEVDISFFFLVFLSIFFAMIIGDGGYGALFLIGSIFGMKKTKGSRATILIFVFSLATIVWGALTGTWFGSQALAENTFLRNFIFEPIYSFSSQSKDNVILFCFQIAFVHLEIAHIINFLKEIKQKPRVKAFAQIGWMAMIVGLYFLVLSLVLNPEVHPVPDFAVPMIIGGLGGVILFGQQSGNFFKGILAGLNPIRLLVSFLDSISAFSDIISYIRLYAVGLASVQIAKGFNDIAFGIMADGGPIIVLGIVVLLLGHSLNVVMGALSIIVHGVRLNMLEFSGHIGMEWSGIAYKPFDVKREIRNNN